MKSKISQCVLCILILTNLGGCKSDDVKVSSKNGVKTSSALSETEKAKNSTSVSSTDEKKTAVYFSEISLNLLGTPTYPLGIAFLATGTSTTRPFSYRFANDDLVYGAQVFFPGSKQLLYSWKSGNAETTLSLFDPKNHGTLPLATLSSTRVVKLASSRGRVVVAWVDTAGGAWLLKGGTSQPSQIRMDGFVAADIQVASQSTEVLISGSLNNRSAFYWVSNTGVVSTPFFGTHAVISPAGTKIAYVPETGSEPKLVVLDRVTQTMGTVGTGEGITEVTWKTNHELTTVTVENDETETLRLLDLDTGDYSAIVTLHIPKDRLTGSMVCPAWNGNTVYFSDFNNSRLSIYLAKSDGRIWQVKPFAQPDDGRSGFICPKIPTEAR